MQGFRRVAFQWAISIVSIAMPTTAVLAASIDLPIEPQATAVGDLDGDGSAEIVLLLIWPRWASASRTTMKEGVMDLEVVPAIKERRELRVYRLEGSRLREIAAPLPVGFEVLALAGDAPRGNVVVLLDRGPARLRLEVAAIEEGDEQREGGAKRLRLVIDAPAEIQPAMAGAERIYSGYPLMADLDGDASAEVLVPTSEGVSILDDEGEVMRLETPLREVRSGESGRLLAALPRFADFDGDGTKDALEISGMSDSWRSDRVAFRKGLGALRFGEATIWSIDFLLEATGEERRENRARSLWDVFDVDGDGTLEAAVALERVNAESVGEQMDLIRGEEIEVTLHALKWNASVESESESRSRAIGHPWYLEHEGGWISPFHDLDGDGRRELMTTVIRFGYFGALRAIVSGRIKARLIPHVYEWDGRQSTFGEIDDAVAPSTFRQNLRNFDLSRFTRFPGDIDGDGRIDMVDVAGAEVKISLGRAGPHYPRTADRTVRLEGKVRGFRGISFFDLDGKGWLDLVAFEPRRIDKEDPSEPGRLEVILLEGPEDVEQ